MNKRRNSYPPLLDWINKKQAINIAKKKLSIEFHPNNKIFIGKKPYIHKLFEGDNLDALKHLNKELSGKIDLLFIDPPYNSGKDFIINDINKKRIKFWKTGTSHSKWLRMLYSRLILARKLLKNDCGIVFFTIDDKELTFSRLILDEIFGEENFIGIFVWKSMNGTKPHSIFTFNHTYIIVYAKNRNNFKNLKYQFRSLDTSEENQPYESIWADLPTSIAARENLIKELNGILPENICRFLNVKPIKFLDRILQLGCNSRQSIILDLFAGTGSMALTTLKFNKKHSMNHRYIGIQYPTPISLYQTDENEKYINPKISTVFDVTLYRIDKCMKKSEYFENNGFTIYKQ